MDADKIADIIFILAVIAVIILKIINVITISWLWLLSPIWISLGIGCVLAALFAILYIIELYKNSRRK